MLKARQAYFQTQVTTTSQGELVVLLYGGAIKYLHLAKEKMEAKDFAEKGILISKALDIIQELDASLNMEQGGEISVNLHSLYVFAQKQLLQANLKMDTKIVDEVIAMLTSLREAFAAIINTPEAIQAQKLAPEQAPVNVAQFRDSGPFGLNEVKTASAAASLGASMSTMARAYRQQSNFGQAVPAVSEQGRQISSQAAAQPDLPPAGLLQTPPPSTSRPAPAQPDPVQAPAAQKPLSPAQNPAAQNSVTQVPPPAAAAAATRPAPAAPLSPNQQLHSQALTGFARQMLNNSLYKKMALNNQAQASENNG